MNIRTLIVDDETLARDRIRQLLAPELDLEIAGECANGADAIEFLQNQRTDLMFLDVQMPELSGFDVLRAVPSERWPVVIFVTAHDQHAVEAFDVGAVDYLLKPFSQARLQAAVERVRQQVRTRDLATMNRRLATWLKQMAPEPAYLSRVAVKSGQQTRFVRVEDIDYIEAAANYAVLKAGTETHIIRETLSNFESKLPPQLFHRISRSIIVNLERVREIQSGARGEYVIVLHNNQQLQVTRGLQTLHSRLQYPSSPGTTSG